MILHTDGSAPLLMIVLMVIFFFIYRKEQKENKIMDDKIKENNLNMEDYIKARDAIHAGAKVLKLDDYKHLTQRDIKFYSDLHGVKFI